MELLKLSDIIVDGGTQARSELIQSLITKYADQMKEGAIFPPVVVFHDGDDYWLADGFHRYYAAKSLGHLEIQALVHGGDQRSAKLFGMEANRTHGMPMSAAEVRANIVTMLKDPEWGLWSLRKIADHVGASHMTVARVKESLGSEAKEPAPKPKKEPKVPDGSKKDPAVTPVTPPQDDRLDELAETVNTLAEENALLRDKIAIGQWDASEIEKIDIEETVTELREKVRVLEIENAALRDSRDMFQNRNAELLKQVKSLQAKLKKLGAE